jgi:hypothetical protein
MMVMMMDEEEEEKGRESVCEKRGKRTGDWQVTSDTGGGSQGCHVGLGSIVTDCTSGPTYILRRPLGMIR